MHPAVTSWLGDSIGWWEGDTHFTRSDERMIEAACHEGNYTMRFMLEAARTLEAAH